MREIPPDPRASCRRKSRYSDEAFAMKVARECWRERRVDLRAYACDECGGWHLTHRDAAPMMRPGWRPPALPYHERESSNRGERRRKRRR